MPVAPLPNFMIIGVERNATRWLRFNLDRHPDICAPPLDLAFFADEQEAVTRGLRWYREQFSSWDGEAFVGEHAPGYLSPRHGPERIAARIRRVLPDMRFVIIVGNPIEGFESALRHQIRWGRLPADTTINNFYDLPRPQIEAVDLVGGRAQFSCIDPFVRIFGDQVHLATLDDVRADPVGVYNGVLEHIGAPVGFVPDDLARARYSDRHAIQLDEVTLRDRQYLYAWFRADVERLAGLMGRDLSAWDPGQPEPEPERDAAFSQRAETYDAVPADAGSTEDGGANP